MQINVKEFSHEQIKAKVMEILSSELKAAPEKCPKVLKKNGVMAEQLGKITAEDMEIRSFSGRRIIDMQMDLERYYIYTETLSTDDMFHYAKTGNFDTAKDFKEDPVTVTASMLGLETPIIFVNHCDSRDVRAYAPVIKKTVEKFYPGTVWMNYNDEPTNKDMYYNIRKRYVEIYNEVNATRLYNHPQRTTAIDISNMSVIEEEEFIGDLYGIAVMLKSKDGENLQMRVAEYDESTGELTVRPIDEILAASAVAENGECFKVSERVVPTKFKSGIGKVLGKIGEILKGGFEIFLDSFNKH
ncbi:MAG: hypothetical protein E7617_02365 [Ruminococcaceae bacterium]|nr:hypothetical protein [Oscillospiraceae bacterium]